MSEFIATEQRDHLLLIRIQRPERKNALTHAMYTALTQALVQAEATPATRAVVLTGCHGDFCAGNDMHDFLEQPPAGQDSPVMRFLATIRHFPKPIIAAVEGVAVGVGTTLLLHCDLVYVTPTARLKMPFTQLGVTPEAGSSMLLPAMLGHQRAAALLLLGETLNGEKAVQLGIANDCSPNCLEIALQQAARLADLPPAAIRATKQLMKQAQGRVLDTQMAQESELFFERLSSPEAHEAMQAFVEKRAADFSRFE